MELEKKNGERNLDMIKGIGHIGIAVKDIEESIATITKALGIPAPSIRDVREKQMKVALLMLNDIGLEVIEDYSENGAFVQFVHDRGNAIHHFCLLTDNIEADIEALKERGVEMADERPRIGLRGKKIAFTKPSALNGIPFELSEE